jgi:zinc protease
LAALECMVLILGQGASSRLYKKLRMEQNLVNSVGAGLWAPSQADGFVSISGSLNPKNLEKAFSEIQECLNEFLEKGAIQEELDKAKINFLSEEAYTMETVGGLARKYGGNFEAVEDLHFHEKFHQSLAEVTKEDVLNVARKYLNPQQILMTAMVPGDKTKVEKLFADWTFKNSQIPVKPAGKAINKKRAEAKISEAASQVESQKLPNGLQMFSRKSLETPIYNLRLAFLGGALVVPESMAGLAELAGRVWSSQTKKNSEQRLRELTDGMASSLYSYSGRNTLGLVVDGLSEFESNLAGLFEDVLIDFDIQGSILEREKISIYETLRSRKDSPATIAVQWFQKMIFQGHPYAVDPLGSEETLARITAKDVKEYLRQVIHPDGAVASMSGDFRMDLWKQALAKLQTGGAKFPAQLHIAQPLDENIYHYEKLEKEQTHIICGVQGLTLDSPDRYTLQVLEAVLSGQGGRLFIELRDKASLAYSVSPMKMEGLGAGYFATYIGCSPSKVDTAIAMMQDELQKMVNSKISQEELLRAQNYLIGGHDIGLQKNSSVASSIAFNEIYGLSYAEIYDYGLKVRSVNSDDVQRLAKKMFSQPFALSVVGPSEPKSRPKKGFL